MRNGYFSLPLRSTLYSINLYTASSRWLMYSIIMLWILYGSPVVESSNEIVHLEMYLLYVRHYCTMRRVPHLR